MSRRVSPGAVVGLLLGALVCLVAVGIWMALGAFTAYERLTDARAGIAALQSDVTEGDLTGLDDQVSSLRKDTGEAREALDTWAWRLASHVPLAGDDVTALRTVVGVTDDLAQGPVESLARAATRLTADSLTPVDGRIPLEPLRDVAPDVSAGLDGLLAARGELRQLDVRGVAAPIAEAVGELRGETADLVDRVALADRLVTLLPPMLGGDGPRRYLLINQNNAEARSLGGIAGAVILVTANDGRIKLQSQVAGNKLGALEELIVPLTPAEQSLFGTGLGRYFLNATNTPDFPRAAELAAARWKLDRGQDVAGVVSVDPGALALLLRATGPVTVAGTELTPGNASDVLLNGVYASLPDPAAQDAFFTAAAKQIFDRLAAGRADVRVAVESLRQATDEGRLMVWASRSEEEEALSGSPIAGELDGRAGGRPELGVYRFETTASKLSYYQDVKVTTRPVCSADPSDAASSDIAVRVELTSQVPRSRAARDALPDYVATDSRPRGTMETRLYLYAPPGGTFGTVLVDGEPQGVISVQHDGLFVVALDLRVRPGRTVAVVTRLQGVDVDGSDGAKLLVRSTPTARQDQLQRVVMDCE